jgi:hypothetical protein
MNRARRRLGPAERLAAVLSHAGRPSHWSSWLMVAGGITVVASAAFVWWVAGLKIDAADAMTAEPPIAAWGGAALIVCAVSILGFLAATIIAATRERWPVLVELDD